MAKNDTPKEHDEQVAFVDWLEVKKCQLGEDKLDFYAVPNSQGVTCRDKKSLMMMIRAKKEGHRNGVPDIVVLLPEVGTLYIEMKRIKGGTIRPEQKKWHAFLNTMPSTQAFFAKGAGEAIRIVEKFLALAKTKV